MGRSKATSQVDETGSSLMEGSASLEEDGKRSSPPTMGLSLAEHVCGIDFLERGRPTTANPSLEIHRLFSKQGGHEEQCSPSMVMASEELLPSSGEAASMVCSEQLCFMLFWQAAQSALQLEENQTTQGKNREGKLKLVMSKYPNPRSYMTDFTSIRYTKFHDFTGFTPDLREKKILIH